MNIVYIIYKGTTVLTSMYYGIATPLFRINNNKPLLNEIIKKPQEAAILFQILIVTRHLKCAVFTHRAASARSLQHMGFLCLSCVPGLLSLPRPAPERADSTLSIALT